MKKSKLYQSLEKLTVKEIHAFEDHLKTLGHAPGSPAMRMIKEFGSTILEKAPLPEKQSLFIQVFGQEIPFQDKKVRVLHSQLFTELKRFLAKLELEERLISEDLLALAQFRKRKANTVFEKQWSQIRRKLDQGMRRDSDYHFATFELALEANGFYGQQHLRKLDDSLQSKMDALDTWYLSQKLKESCEMLNRQNVFSIEFSNPMIDHLLQFLQEGEHSFWEIPSVQIYYQIYLCLAEGKDEQYQELVALLDQLYSFFHPEEARGMYKHAQNFCIRRINQGEQSYLGEVFHLYQKQLSNQLIFDRGDLAHTDYKNIVTVGLRLSEYDWVYSFIHQYKEKVQLHQRENVFSFALASYLFETGQSQQAIRLLQEVEFSDVYYQISARQLLLKIYYRENELESGLYQADAFKVFLRRNKEISVKNRNQHNNFIRWYKHLVRLKDKKEILEEKVFIQRWEQLKGNIFNSNNTSSLEWLKTCILQLASKKFTEG